MVALKPKPQEMEASSGGGGVLGLRVLGGLSAFKQEAASPYVKKFGSSPQQVHG